jgi:hypothetical protein
MCGEERRYDKIRTSGEANFTGTLEMRSGQNTGTTERNVEDGRRREYIIKRVIKMDL